MTRLTRVLCALLVATAVFAGLPVASAEKVYTVDDNHELDDADAIAEYHDTGAVSADVQGLDMTVTVSDDRREAGVDALTGGVMHTYVRVQYREEIDRTVRFYLPAEYAQPRLKEGLESETDEATAMLEPVAGGEYMAVTIQFREPTDATFAINDAFGSYLSTTEWAYSTVENATGFSPPRLGARGHKQWHYPPEGALAGDNATYHIPLDPERNTSEEGMTIQFDNKPNSEESAWMTMPKCSQSVEPVCVTERDGEPVLFSTSSENVPPIRYKYGTDRKAEAKGAIEELKDSWGGLIDRLGGLAGGFGG